MDSCRTVLCSCSQNVDECRRDVRYFSSILCPNRNAKTTHAQARPRTTSEYTVSLMDGIGSMSVAHAIVTPTTKRKCFECRRVAWRK